MNEPLKPNTPDYSHDDAVSRFIDRFWQERFRSPTIREIKEGCGISSTSAASYIVKRVTARRGDHVVTDGSARGITPQWVREAIIAAQPH